MKHASPVKSGARYEALLQLLRTAEALWNSSREFFARWDLSPSQFNILNLLHEAPDGLSQSDLSRQLIMHRSNVTGLVDRLETRGLVRRAEHAADRRAWRVMLTAAGRKLLAELHPVYFRAAEEVWGKVPVSHARQVVRDLAVVSENAAKVAKRIS